jgi:hypothetical protein
LLSEVLKLDPDNRSIAWEINLRKHRVLSIEAYSGEARKSWEEYKMLLPGFEADFNQSMKSDFGAAVDLAEMEIDFSALAYRQGDQQGAREELGKALQRLVQLIREKPDNRASRYQVARAAFEQWAQTGQLPQADIDAALGDYLRDPASVKSCSDIGLAAKLAVMHGDEMLARRYTSQLREKGFFDPQFMSFCRGYGICD